jgi:hypothetical protein
MPKFEVRVRLLDVSENDAWTARQAVEERLRAAGFTRWQIASLRLEDAAPPPRLAAARRRRRRGESSLAGGLIITAALAWSFWFWWALF